MEQQADLLTDIHEELALEPATTGIRFANYLLDMIAFYIAILLVGIVFGLLQVPADDKPFQYLISYLVYIFYYTIMEGATGGKTLGKLITGTRAVKEDGTPITWKDALLRSLSRIVPFEPFSALGGHPWHDRWTDTQVVKSRKRLE